MKVSRGEHRGLRIMIESQDVGQEFDVKPSDPYGFGVEVKPVHDWYSVTDLTHIFGVSRAAVCGWIRKGEVQAQSGSGWPNRWQIPKTEVERMKQDVRYTTTRQKGRGRPRKSRMAPPSARVNSDLERLLEEI